MAFRQQPLLQDGGKGLVFGEVQAGADAVTDEGDGRSIARDRRFRRERRRAVVSGRVEERRTRALTRLRAAGGEQHGRCNAYDGARRDAGDRFHLQAM